MLGAIQSLFHSRKFLLAILAVVVTGLQVAFPQLPKTIVDGVQTLVLALIAAITAEDFAAKIRGK